MLKRFFSRTSRCSIEEFEKKVPFKPHYSNPQRIKKFEKNLPLSVEPVKVWDKQGITKDEFFMRKYGNLSEYERSKLTRKNDSRRKQREHFKNIESEKAQQEKIEARREKNKKYEGDDFGGDTYRGGYRRDNTMLEFVYGTHSVKSVLTANKRASYSKLYVYNCKDKDLITLATKHGIRVKYCDSNQELARLTKNGVHNGVVLETMKLPVKTIHSLGECKDNKYEISVFEKDSDEVATAKQEKVIRNDGHGTNETKFPLGLYLDRITDPQNMGNIVRSAYFFGVDFIVVPEENTAKLGSVANKASVGSLDMMNIYQCSQAIPFVERIRENGWSVITTSGKPVNTTDPLEVNLRSKFVESNELSSILSRSPVLLVIGSEGYGVDNNLKVRSDFLVAIEKGRNDDQIVDSLNVGVATGILIGKCVE